MPDKVWPAASDNDGDEVAFELTDLLSFATQRRLHADTGALVLGQRGEEALPLFGGGRSGLGGEVGGHRQVVAHAVLLDDEARFDVRVQQADVEQRPR